MPLIALPSQILIREDSWQQSDPRIIQQSEFTGRTRELLIGPAARWTCEVDVVALRPDDLTAVRAFLAAMAIPGNFTQLPIHQVGGQQLLLPGSSSAGIVNGAGQLGRTLSIHTLAPSVTHLRAGHMITFGASLQTVTLTADLVANGSGVALASFDQPMRASPANGSPVALRFPIVWMRLRNPMQWRTTASQLSELPRLQFEELF